MNSIQIEQKRAELQVKLTILKENFTSLNHQFEESNTSLALIAQKNQPVNKLIEAKRGQIQLLKSEMEKELSSLNGLKSYYNSLMKEKDNSESEIIYYNQRYVILKEKNDELKSMLYDMTSKQDKLNSFQEEKTHPTQIQTILEDKRVISLQRQIDSLNKDISTLDGDDEKDETKSFYDSQIKHILNEIDETCQSIAMNKEKKRKYEVELKELYSILFNLNKINIQINASINIIQASLSKKAAYMLHDRDYFDDCLKAKKNIINTIKEASTLKNIIYK